MTSIFYRDHSSIDEAHKLKAKITGHLCSVTFREAADLGIDQLEHGFIFASDFLPNKKPDKCPEESILEQWRIMSQLSIESEKVQSLFRHLIDNNVVVTSMLANHVSKLPGEYLPYEDDLYLLSEESRKDALIVRNTKMHDFYKDAVQAEMLWETAFWKAGGTLVVGTDALRGGMLPGLGTLRTIELLSDAGIPPIDVIKIATLNGAEAIGVAKDRGSIVAGKRADLIVIDGNPATDIKDIYKVEIVFKDGIGYDPVTLKNSATGRVGAPG